MQMKNLYNSIYIEEYEVELDQIPDMAGFSHYVEDYGGEPPYVKYCYFYLIIHQKQVIIILVRRYS